MNSELFEKICRKLKLGELKYQPESLKGGLTHKMYSLFTTEGKYAVKLLNPYIMKRNTAMGNYRTAEELELKLEQHGIPIVPALIFNGKKMQEIDGQYFYLFDWYEGKRLKNDEITVAHCREIGKYLAAIHSIDRQEAECERDEIHIDWDFYIDKMKSQDKELHSLLLHNRQLFYESQEKGNLAIKKIPAVQSICHNDMDSKNVLWKGEECRIIDLESLSFFSSFIELYEVALCWSGYEICNINYDFMRELIHSYAESGGELPTDWETIYYSNYGRLEWLEYNIKRVLGIDCAEDEQELGVSEVRETVDHVIYYDKEREKILNCLNLI